MEIETDMDCRGNSRFATLRKVPRYTLVHFAGKNTRDRDNSSTAFENKTENGQSRNYCCEISLRI